MSSARRFGCRWALLLALSIWTAVSAATNGACATTIGFDTLDTSGPGLPDFTSYSQSGFLVTAASGNWFSSGYGDPGPGIAAFNFDARTLTVTHGGSDFRFGSVDLDAFLVDAPFTFTGILGGVVQFAVSGLSPGIASATFTTAINPDPSTLIDVLDVTVGAPDYPYYISLDNVVVFDASIPEPAALTVIGASLACLWLVRQLRSVPPHADIAG